MLLKFWFEDECFVKIVYLLNEIEPDRGRPQGHKCSVALIVKVVQFFEDFNAISHFEITIGCFNRIFIKTSVRISAGSPVVIWPNDDKSDIFRSFNAHFESHPLSQFLSASMVVGFDVVYFAF